MSENTFILNGNEVAFEPGQTILEARGSAGSLNSCGSSS